MPWPLARALALVGILPASSDVWLSLWLGNPVSGGVELTLTGYARVAFQDWTTTDFGSSSARSNASVILFASITAAGTSDYWAIMDSSVGGTVLRSNFVLNAIQSPQPIIFTGAATEPRFTISALQITATDPG